MIGKKEKITTGSNCYAVCRENGAVIAAAKGENITVSVPNGNVAPGTYTDLVSNTTWTVTESTISGKLGSTGIAVFYSDNPVQPTTATTAPTTVATTPSSSGNTPVGKVVIGDANSDGKVTISDATEIQMHVAKMKTLTGNAAFAADVNDDGSITIKDATAVQYYLSHQYSSAGKCGNVIGEDPTTPTTPTTAPTNPVVDTTKVYFRNTSNWSPVKAYFWSDSNTQMMSWPGIDMQSEGNNVYSATIPNGATMVIFTKGDDSGKTPDLTLQAGKIYSNGSWSDYTGGGTVVTPTNPDVDTSKVYFKNNNNWSPVKAYFWSDSNTQMMTWPGIDMQSEGNNIYSVTIPSGATKVIFTKGDDSGKTPDLDLQAGKLYDNGWTSL